MGKQKFKEQNRMSISEQSATSTTARPISLQLPRFLPWRIPMLLPYSHDQIDKAPEEKPAESRSTRHT